MAVYLKTFAFAILCGAFFTATILLRDCDLTRTMDYKSTVVEANGCTFKVWLQDGTPITQDEMRGTLEFGVTHARGVCTALKISDIPKSLDLTITRDRKEFDLRAKATTYSDDTNFIQGYFLPDKNEIVVMATDSRLKETVTHEFVHAILSNERKKAYNVNRHPLWMDEGLAEYAGFAEQMSRHMDLVEPSNISVAAILAGGPKQFYNAGTGHHFYHTSALLVCFLLESYPDRFVELYSRAGSGSVDASDFEKLFGKIAEVNEQFKEFLRTNVSRFGDKVKDIK